MTSSVFLMCLLALLPIIWLVFALCFLKLQPHWASIGAFVTAAIEALLIWHMSVIEVTTAALEGVAMAIWPIVLVIIAAVFTYNLTVHSKAMEVIKSMMTSISSDRRILVILIGWCFGGFLEGMAGFGVAIAIPASMLYALGFSPIEAILACLIANGGPTMFGSIGIPTTTLANLTALEPMTLAFIQSIQAAPLLLLSPFLMVALVAKGLRGLKGLIPLLSVSALSFVLPEILAARFIGADLPVVIAGICSLAATFAYALYYGKHHDVPKAYEMEIPKNNTPITLKTACIAWSPFILIFLSLLLTSKLFPFLHDPLSAVQTSVTIYQGANAAPYTFTWLNTPGVLILCSGIVGGLMQGCSVKELFQVLGATIRQMAKTIYTMLGVLACAKIMSYSGMISDIAAFFVTALGAFYPLAAPLIGALGTFVTGSGTSSEVLFGNVQLEAAAAIQMNPYWLVAANSLGTAAGKMLAPQSIAIGCAACSLVGKDGEILKRIATYAFAYVILMAMIIYFCAPLCEYLLLG